MDFSNYIEEDREGKAQFLWVSLFYYMAETCIRRCSLKGEKVIRQAVRDFGEERAIRKRQRSDAMGMAPNLESMTKVLDLYGEPRFSFGKQISKVQGEEKIIQVFTCPNCNIWARLEGKKPGDYLNIGSIYCEEVHHYLYGKYDPAIQVNLCEILTKGDNLCNFRLHMREANREAIEVLKYEKQSWEDYEGMVAESIFSIYCLNFFHYSKAILEKLGEDILIEALHCFAQKRVERIKELNRRQNLENTIQNFWVNRDLWIDKREKAELISDSDGNFRVIMSRDIMKEVFTTHGGAQLCEIYFEHVVKYMIDAYSQSLTARLEEQGEKTVILIERK